MSLLAATKPQKKKMIISVPKAPKFVLDMIIVIECPPNYYK
jgi:hypothetical protein